MCILSAALYVGTPRASRSLEASDGGRWVPGGLGGAVLTLAPPGVSPGASRRLWVPAVWKPLPQTQPRAPLGPQGRCQLCPYLRAHPAGERTCAPTLPAVVPPRPPCRRGYRRARPARPHTSAPTRPAQTGVRRHGLRAQFPKVAPVSEASHKAR